MRFVMVLLVWVMAAGPAAAVDTAQARATLKGMTALAVLVETFNEEAKSAGFNASIFQQDVELKLRLAGIDVVDLLESFGLPGNPYLYVNVNVPSGQRGDKRTFSGEVELHQDVRLERNEAIYSSATTWNSGGSGKGDLPYVRDSVKTEVDTFINAWLSVNP